ncbi:MAG: glycoside hydrolase family 43 protein [Clostridia bacterium]|nr:glycoside hydrolase family 43 protein [Clostridia bacterium]
MPYLFTHFREKLTPDGEQVYFAVSKDGFNWEQLNGGRPVLTAEKGFRGCRDIEVVRLLDGSFAILTTDELIVERMDENHNVNWKTVNRTGSKCIRMWKTKDLINFSEETLLPIGTESFGCMWAPEVFVDEEKGEYLIHWGSTVKEDGYSHMSVFCSRTKDFVTFTEPELFFTKDNEILDTHIRKIGDTYHMFYKNADHPPMNMHATAESLYGPWKHDEGFEEYMASLGNAGSYEAPTTIVLPDGRWCLMLDFFGCEKEKMGYVPFVSPEPGDSSFTMAKESFSFPYGFKHGGTVEISDEEYNRLKEYYKN